MCRHSTTVSMPHPRWRTALASGLLTLIALWPLAAQPQTVQTIKLVVGYAPGGPVDAAARLFAPVFAREVGGWYALYGPAKLPADIVARYNDATRKALAGDDLKHRLVEQGYDLWTGSAQLLAERAAASWRCGRR